MGAAFCYPGRYPGGRSPHLANKIRGFQSAAVNEWFRLVSGPAQTTVFMRATHVAMTSSTGIAHQRLEKISTST
jgi:hypothetical protein